jgi:hypothetical protein
MGLGDVDLMFGIGAIVGAGAARRHVLYRAVSSGWSWRSTC